MRTLEATGNHKHFSFLVFAFILPCLRIVYIMDISESAFLQEGRPPAYRVGLQGSPGLSI